MLFVFGREVERFIGRRAYIALYLLLLVAPAVLLAIWGLWQRSVLSFFRFTGVALWNFCRFRYHLSPS